ncbi:MAG: nucleotide exchange factor GrpE [Candidatus Kerfeldbacteria bacterium RIFCSPLOWO2_01_FULL_48_11]|uniref:Protein GrpE n=1 Tax=Candidatus Kerfeldbacteria bacterium RIFCSPLOWO2_01_FULL_48_11 TaxID=1798543 RepID=A0A1G2B1W0_9BACT|nr:MAG: Protein GrpE [Parcubacteria group bacterium GW2011_GWA2_48_9]KKW14725.1 MAG: Protein GrpE [Parcubacteria group bacterium GW2011_GWC2_49_9]OGY83144.1 MAG: nucleotide exchange factor GrpE [Candidatus Kerfeldbacteria bacterium RIFCSPLOWO2_01_FULL_48_11]HCJ52818.1 nucleotide exchange factor GrpE [Candidatus Kerfeldbacteria bacterium]HCM68187.1 nucleotide exchange factor GrpE [Candidatus Kerfeldbacteria bacterium]
MTPEHQQKDEHQPTEIEKLQKQAEEYLDGWKRAKADYLNQKKEFEKREKEVVQFANAGLIIELIPIYNHLKLALKHKPAHQDTAHWVKGIEHIAQELKTFFSQMGIEEIPTKGQKFNTDQHEAVAHEKREGIEHDVIIEEVEPGYMMLGKTIHPAKVKVAQ